MNLDRKSRYKILPQILNRWSPRAMNGKSVSKSELFTLFEAARWAPSSGNNQPWRFIYTTHRSFLWKDYLSLLNEGNREWCMNAAALIIIISKTTFDYNGSNSKTHAFDAGAAWENLAIQGTSIGLVVHAMEGFDYDKAREILHLPKEYEIMAMVAVGHPGDVDLLSSKNQSREFPSKRKRLSEIVSREKFIW